MNIDGIPTRTVRAHPAQNCIDIIDQTRLPHALAWVRVATLDEAAHAIRAMQVRGAPLIGATAAYGLAIALEFEAADARLDAAIAQLGATRPTAVNLHWALARMERHLRPLPPAARHAAAWEEAAAIADEDVAQNAAIGRHGLAAWQALIARRAGQPLRIMTHCNAGWLATVDWGTALSPVYAAHDAGVPVQVWVSETRPRNQGLLTAWELAQHGVPHTLIADNAAGILLRNGEVDAVIVGADRIAANGDVANKVGTYLKALACADNGIPFYVAAPRSTLDFACASGDAIPIEEREGDEFRLVHGLDAHAQPAALRQLPTGEAVANPAFDVTPARLITGIITERGICPASREGLLGLYPEAAAGNTAKHNRISLNLAIAFRQHLTGQPCETFIADLKVHAAAANAFYYPDVVVRCQAQPLADEQRVISDPTLIVEVLSPSTEGIDRREKLAAYRRIPSVQEYALIAQEERSVEIYRRQGDIGWTYHAFTDDEPVELASIGLTLPMAAFYA